jgi:hypothetical protein
MLLEGRLALMRGSVDAALVSAGALGIEAAERYAPRYVALGAALAMQAHASIGKSPDDSEVIALSARLATIAGLEAWRILGELGSVSHSPLCFELAARRRDALAERLDTPARERFVAHADRRLATMRRATAAQ